MSQVVKGYKANQRTGPFPGGEVCAARRKVDLNDVGQLELLKKLGTFCLKNLDPIRTGVLVRTIR
jgi:hypothetical protein